MEVNSLFDLISLRSAPKLSKGQVKKLQDELEEKILYCDWLTIGIISNSDFESIEALKLISKKYSSIKFLDLDSVRANGSVFLKANQKTGNVFIRSENGLGEGILLTCQCNEDSLESKTFGPFPLDFFSH